MTKEHKWIDLEKTIKENTNIILNDIIKNIENNSKEIAKIIGNQLGKIIAENIAEKNTCINCKRKGKI